MIYRHTENILLRQICNTENVTCTPTMYLDAAGNPNSGERFFCMVCGKNYLRKRHLQRHMRDECIGIPPRFECEFCPSKFRRKYHLVRHLNSRHSDMITKENTGIKVNSRPKMESMQGNSSGQQRAAAAAAAVSTNDEDSDSAVASTSSGVTSDNLVMNAAAIAAAAEFAANFTKDFSVDAIMMKREPSEIGIPMPDLKLLEELQKKVNFAVNPDLFSTIRQMNPIKY